MVAAAPLRTGSFNALGHVFAVGSDDRMLADLCENVFAALAVDEAPSGWYGIHREAERGFDLTWNDRSIVAGVDRMSAFDSLLAHVDRRAVAAADGDLVLRAGCAARGTDVVLVGGASRTGKSTLVAALVAEGFEYLADGMLPVDRTTARVSPFARPLALDDHSLDLLPEVPAIRTSQSSHGASKRLVAMGRPRTERVSAPLAVSMIVFPQHLEAGRTAIEPMSRAEAVVELAEQSFNFPSHGHDGIDVLVRLTQDASCHRLVADDPHAASAAVVELFDRSRWVAPSSSRN